MKQTSGARLLHERELDAFRRSKRLPDNLSKRFVEGLTLAERRILATNLASIITRAEASERILVTTLYRLMRVQKIRRSKGEII